MNLLIFDSSKNGRPETKMIADIEPRLEFSKQNRDELENKGQTTHFKPANTGLQLLKKHSMVVFPKLA